MLSAYPACFIKEENGYSVIFPDLNYLATCGDTLEESFTMAVDCLAGYLYWLQKDGENAPPASSFDMLNPAEIAGELEVSANEIFLNMVTVDVAEYARTHFEKSIKKTLTIPAWLNKAALEQNINFSQVLQEALKAKLFQH
ncbi:MAG: type II toxin-antitoxin system HicB family antitoxin [Bacillus sp. (in: Bacteria)]|nr:type II toxin-antitoxin system HicB family antitoxin [Bacillus sp. (in: firmicutes)]MCM1425900.1 type II toxin-antitoxin system HicB family antitoxin [Eubacterium sp.]